MDENKRATDENDENLILAKRKCLFRLTSFLDNKLPDYCSIHTFVRAALLTKDPTYYIYFRRRHSVSSPTTLEEDDYSLIVGARAENFMDSKQQNQKCWTLFYWAEEMERLTAALNSIGVINWHRDAIVINYKHDVPLQSITHFLISKQGQEVENNPCYPCHQYVLPINHALSLHLSKMDNVYVKSLERCHAQMVYDHWPYRESTTVKQVADEIDQLPSTGVFLKENNELVSWMMCHPPNGMSRLHTLENHRRRGYAALVAQYLTKRVAQSGCIPYVNIVTDNDASYKLFEKLGFRRSVSSVYIHFTRPCSTHQTQ